MFTGLIEARGRIVEVRRSGGAARLRVEAPFTGELTRGESVSVNGVCLTVAGLLAGSFEAEAVERTLSRTTLAALSPGDEVNLERALEMGDRLAGHMVTGHVDGVGVVMSVRTRPSGRDVAFDVPTDLRRYVVERGSIAVDGTSLTVAAVEGTRVTVSLIPETLQRTIAMRYRAGSKLNIETDIAAKYQESLARNEPESARAESGITLGKLRELGFTE